MDIGQVPMIRGRVGDHGDGDGVVIDDDCDDDDGGDGGGEGVWLWCCIVLGMAPVIKGRWLHSLPPLYLRDE